MFSACQLRMLTTLSRIRLELLLYSQAGNADLSTWALKLRTALQDYPEILKEVSPILGRAIDEDDWVLDEVRLSAISNAILSYTSATEFYLSDLIQLKLEKMPNLFKRALDLKEVSINRMDIVNFSSIEQMRKKYIKQLSYEFIGGELWTKKFIGASKLFDIPVEKTSLLLKSIDSIWIHRNKIAHMNKNAHLPITIINLNGKEIVIENLSGEGYMAFCINLLELMTKGCQALKAWEKSISQKWDKNFIDLDLMDELDEIEKDL